MLKTTLIRRRAHILWLSFVLAAPSRGQWIVNPANGHEYGLTNGAYWGASDTSVPTLPDWWDAEAEAVANGGHLVTINDAAENGWLVTTFGSSTRFLIGLTDWGSEGSFHWINGEPVTYLKWDVGQPDNAHAGGEDIVHMNHSGVVGNWNDLGAQGNSPSHPNPYRGIIERLVSGVVYCTAGTTTNGCVATIGSSGTPSATASSGFTISVAAIEGLKQGILFYGISNTGFSPTPWGTSTSYLCVKHPTQRMGVLNTGGTYDMCDGSLAVDWNAYRAAHPTALGSPFSVGQHVFAQCWFRDPPSPKTTMLSDGLEFILQP